MAWVGRSHREIPTSSPQGPELAQTTPKRGGGWRSDFPRFSRNPGVGSLVLQTTVLVLIGGTSVQNILRGIC